MLMALLFYLHVYLFISVFFNNFDLFFILHTVPDICLEVLLVVSILISNKRPMGLYGHLSIRDSTLIFLVRRAPICISTGQSENEQEAHGP